MMFSPKNIPGMAVTPFKGSFDGKIRIKTF
jgi:hypothetical protein